MPADSGAGTKVPVYNLSPNEGEPALFGFVVAGKEPVFLETEVAWQSDFHETSRSNCRAERRFGTAVCRL